MPAILFLGEELTAAGLRLAGVAARVVGEGGVEAAIAAVGGEVELLLLGAEAAARLEPALLERLLARPRPVTLVLPDPRGRVAPPDPAATLRRVLGVVR
ncbi:MAG: Vacuolar H+transporting two-sector ATPase F subunit [Deltaproteobacteria bacterium]|nr:Vacuolar H+transporting two-sector ATPase F subunit [Deltaproteobacteria bacterium]NCP96445.1 Vacuolar H+transporting two-sector ATPase F subunit [Deltaproteobacteria bacterium]NCS73886.1 Vacuolar H+transporting two-sector ATPase F subunit [Deltaproteobacteria bacterium]